MKKVVVLLLLFVVSKMQSQCWSDLSAYYYQSIGIYQNGTLWGWGSNGSDLFQVGDYLSRTSPTQIGSDADWAQLKMGSNYMLALKTDGTLWAWGYNDEGQLGDGTNDNKTIPVQIGTDTWLSISSAYKSSFGIKSDGSLWAWGNNATGQLGDGTTVQRTTPIPIMAGTSWLEVSTHFNHTLAIQSDGTLWAWGDNGYGQLGDGTNVSRSSPTQVGTENIWLHLSSSPASQYSLAMQNNGSLWAWGYNGYGQLGIGTTGSGVLSEPTPIGSDSDWQQFACGSDHTLALKSDGTLWAWGGNYVGQLGDGTLIQSNSPIQIGNDTNWQKVSAGQGHSLALKSDDSAWSWGFNSFGQLGDATQVDKLSPTAINCSGLLGESGFRSFLDMYIFPNPTSDYITINSHQNLELTRILISDITGKIIIELDKYVEPINIRTLSRGVYLLTVLNGSQNNTIKFIKL